MGLLYWYSFGLLVCLGMSVHHFIHGNDIRVCDLLWHLVISIVGPFLLVFAVLELGVFEKLFHILQRFGSMTVVKGKQKVKQNDH